MKRPESLYLDAADAAEVEFGRADERIVATLQALAHTQYCYIGSYARSEPTSRRLLVLREEIVGFEHPAVAQSWIFLAKALEIGQCCTTRRNGLTDVRLRWPCTR
jgi:hypothetical protein